MGYFRFRRSFKIAPGLRVNVGKRSLSTSFGIKGAHYTTGTAGRRFTVGAPGTGLSYTTGTRHSGSSVMGAIVFIAAVAFIVYLLF
jgi:hypothetical protein